MEHDLPDTEEERREALLDAFRDIYFPVRNISDCLRAELGINTVQTAVHLTVRDEDERTFVEHIRPEGIEVSYTLLCEAPAKLRTEMEEAVAAREALLEELTSSLVPA
jgi:hypothetical protein